MSHLMVFTGNAHPELSKKIVTHLGLPLGRATIGRFSDGESMVEIIDNVRGKDVFIVQPTSAPTNEHVMELIMMADAIRRASALRITAAIPYYGYGRQDRRVRSARVPISAKVVADMLSAVGINRVLTVDLHADQIQGFFSIPVDNAYATPIFIKDIQSQSLKNARVVSPDIGGVIRARAFAKRLNLDLAIVDKRRSHANESQVMNIIGDVAGHPCIIVDDIIDTAGTVCTAANALKSQGATHISVYCTHAILSGHALEDIQASAIDDLVVSDTIPLPLDLRGCKKVRQLTLSEMLAETIRRVSHEESISVMFETESIT